MINQLGLIGHPLSHSFSKKYFTQKFERLHIQDWAYELYPLEKIDLLPALIENSPNLKGLNVTIPYKQAVLPYLDELSPEARAIGAVNTIKIERGQKKGFNTDVYGFQVSLEEIMAEHSSRIGSALVLGTGGAAKAVCWVLRQLGIQYTLVSRHPELPNWPDNQLEPPLFGGVYTYQELDEHSLNQCQLIVNTSPLGMAPAIGTSPDIPYHYLHGGHCLFDLVYNPKLTHFMKNGREQGAVTCNGLRMLHLQADKAWEIWKT